MAEKQNTPEIRFEGFTDPWEQRKLGELCTISKGHGYSKADIRDAGTPLILYGRLYTQYESRIENVDTFAVEQEGSLLSKGNEVIVPASGETAEDIAVASSVRRSGIIFGGDLNVVTPVSKLDPDYIALAITHSKAHDDLAKRAQGKSVVHVHGNDIAEVEIPYPSESEQKRISTVILGLDSLITLHQRKYDKLCTVKKSMLDKMFPKPGETEPEIRFEGFTDPWEQRKLGELMDVASVRRVHQEDWTDEGVRFLRARDLVAFAKNESIEDPLFISSEMYKEYSAQSGKVSVGDLLVTGVGTIGVPWLVTSDNPVYFKDGNIIWFKNRHSIDGGFFYHSFTASAIQNYINEAAGIGTVGTYTIETGKKTPIWLPSRQEQREIAAMMTHLDTLITLHQRKLELLRNIKKSLLDRMFV